MGEQEGTLPFQAVLGFWLCSAPPPPKSPQPAGHPIPLYQRAVSTCRERQPCWRDQPLTSSCFPVLQKGKWRNIGDRVVTSRITQQKEWQVKGIRGSASQLRKPQKGVRTEEEPVLLSQSPGPYSSLFPDPPAFFPAHLHGAETPESPGRHHHAALLVPTQPRVPSPRPTTLFLGRLFPSSLPITDSEPTGGHPPSRQHPGSGSQSQPIPSTCGDTQLCRDRGPQGSRGAGMWQNHIRCVGSAMPPHPQPGFLFSFCGPCAFSSQTPVTLGILFF